LRYKLGCQLYAVWVDLEAPFEDFAVTGDNIQIATCALGVNNLSATIFQLFKTAAATLFAKRIPLFAID